MGILFSVSRTFYGHGNCYRTFHACKLHDTIILTKKNNKHVSFTNFYSKSFQSRDEDIGNGHFFHGFMAKNIPEGKDYFELWLIIKTKYNSINHQILETTKKSK